MRGASAPIRTDKPVPKLTTTGPFRYTRNPSYLALAMSYAGIAVLRFASLWAILLDVAVRAAGMLAEKGHWAWMFQAATEDLTTWQDLHGDYWMVDYMNG
jgi:protein-S-isoprenylcysteine O-methyltransferase Ste14